MPAPFDEGSPRPAGVHLHWAMPDALLRGELDTAESGGRRTGSGCRRSPTAGWCCGCCTTRDGAAEGSRAGCSRRTAQRAVPLAEWSEGGTAKGTGATGVTLTPTELTGTVGGSVLWAATYDAVAQPVRVPRPARVDATGLEDGDLATYLVAGWWKHPRPRPARQRAQQATASTSCWRRLRWRPVRDWGDERTEQQHSCHPGGAAQGPGPDHRRALHRDASERQVRARRRPARTADAFVPKDSMTSKTTVVSASSFSADSPVRYVARPWHLRSSLLHGSVYGVPVGGRRRRRQQARPRRAEGRARPAQRRRARRARGAARDHADAATRRRAAPRGVHAAEAQPHRQRRTGWPRSRRPSTPPRSRTCRRARSQRRTGSRSASSPAVAVAASSASTAR